MAWLEIDVEALGANLASLTALAHGAPAYPVVKADAYGHGAVPVASALEEAGAAGYGVATIDEAVQLREAGITAPILVLYPIPPECAGEAARLDIAVTAGDATLLDELIAALPIGSAPLAIHLEIETGLGRGGGPPGAGGGAASPLPRPPGACLARASRR